MLAQRSQPPWPLSPNSKTRALRSQGQARQLHVVSASLPTPTWPGTPFPGCWPPSWFGQVRKHSCTSLSLGRWWWTDVLPDQGTGLSTSALAPLQAPPEWASCLVACSNAGFPGDEAWTPNSCPNCSFADMVVMRPKCLPPLTCHHSKQISASVHGHQLVKPIEFPVGKSMGTGTIR